MSLRFGIEGEVLLARSDTFEPLWHDRLSFEELNDILERIPTADIPRDGLRPEPPHRSILPYVVEGYDIPAPGRPETVVGRLPKGLEIRTPACCSIAATLELYAVLYDRLEEALAVSGLVPVHLSHHPRATAFRGPRNSAREDWWVWHMAAMTTYGPDVNLGLDPEDLASVDALDLERKLDFYTPALVGFTLDSPVYAGALWRVGTPRDGHERPVGKSARTFLRTPHAPPFLFLPGEGGRLEFKAFDSTSSLADLENDLLLFAAVSLDGRLAGRATPAERVGALQQVAVHGWRAEGVRERAEEVLEAAERTLPEHGLDPAPLERYRRRLDLDWVPADRTAELFRITGSVEGWLREAAGLDREDPLESCPEERLPVTAGSPLDGRLRERAPA